jgi:hypothetical protein
VAGPDGPVRRDDDDRAVRERGLHAEDTRPGRARRGPQLFGNRFDFSRGNASSLALRAATPEGFDVLSAELPWPAA